MNLLREKSEVQRIAIKEDFKDEQIHARHIVMDKGGKILLDRGLDIFQHYEMNDTFSFDNHLQKFRPCKAFEVTYMEDNT